MIIHTCLLLELQSDLTFSSLFKPLLLSVSEDTVVIFSLLAYLLLLCVFVIYMYCSRSITILPEGEQLLPGSPMRHYRRGHLVLPGVLPRVSPGVLPGHGVTWVFIFESFIFAVPKYPRSSNSNFWEKINFHLEVLPGPRPVVVTCSPGPPSGFFLSVKKIWV